MKKTTSYIALVLSLFFNFTSALLADNSVEEHDIIVNIAKKSGGSEYSRAGKTGSSFYEITVEGKTLRVPVNRLSVEYEIFYFDDAANVGKGGAYKSIKGGFNVSDNNGSKENPLITKRVATQDTEQFTRVNNNRRGRNNRGRNNNNRNRNNFRKTSDNQDRIFGILVDVYENSTLIATYADTNRVRDRAKVLREKGQQITPNAFK